MFELIDIIQQYPEVYDLARPRYKDKPARAAAWEEIATGMDTTGELKNCRFINEIKEIINLFSPLYV